ncbi:MAG: hypothetical protein WBX15_08540 [Thermoanaerobaculia bacterium]
MHGQDTVRSLSHRFVRSWKGRSALFIAVIGGLLLTSCASTGRPGTGDLSFRITWTGRADVDLYVESPLREPVNYVQNRAASGGWLDIDCNVHGVSMCGTPMENVFWPRGRAPKGTYRFWVQLSNPEGLTPDDRYTLEVRRGERVVWSTQGQVVDLPAHVPNFEVEFPSFTVQPIEPERSYQTN